MQSACMHARIALHHDVATTTATTAGGGRVYSVTATNSSDWTTV